MGPLTAIFFVAIFIGPRAWAPILYPPLIFNLSDYEKALLPYFFAISISLSLGVNGVLNTSENSL